MITKGERTELRSIVRFQFKVLRSEVDRRHAELMAEMEQRIVARYREIDGQHQALMWKAEEICQAASREVTDLFRGSEARHGYEFDHRQGPDVSIERPIHVHMDQICWSKEDRVQLRRAMVAAIDVDIESAKLQLDRQEADLLRTLAIGAIESEEAREFLGAIPTVGQLVPAARLAELEAQFAEGEPDA